MKYAIGLPAIVIVLALAPGKPPMSAYAGDDTAFRSTFATLGYDQIPSMNRDNPEFSVAVQMPEGSKEESRDDDLHMAVAAHLEVDGLNELQGRAYIEGSWNEKSFLLVKLTPTTSYDGGHIVEWVTNDLVNGPTRGYERTDRLEGVFANFPQFGSVKGGSNILRFAISGDGVGSLSVNVRQDSFVRWSRIGAPVVELTDAKILDDGNGPRMRVKATWDGEPPKWAEFEAVVMGDGGQPEASGSAYVLGEDATTVDVSLTPSPRTLDGAYVFATHPGGDSLPLIISPPTGWWDHINNELPWAWVAIGGLAVLWISVSTLVSTRGENVSGSALPVVALVLSLSLVGPGMVSHSTAPHLPWLPGVSPSEVYQLGQVAQRDSGITANVVSRSNVGVVTDDGKVVGFTIIEDACQEDIITYKPTTSSISGMPIATVTREC